MISDEVICQFRGGALWLTLNRPEAGNRLTIRMFNIISDAMRGVDGIDSAGSVDGIGNVDGIGSADGIGHVGGVGSSNGVRAVVIDANGPDFCLGGELGDHKKMDRLDIAKFADAFIEMLLLIRGCPAPVIVSAAGRVHGGGICLIGAADIAIVRDGATLAIPEILGGRPPVLSFVGASEGMPEKVLMRMALFGEEIGAKTARQYGYVSAIARDKAEQDSLCEEYIQKIAHADGHPVRVIKALRTAADGGQYERKLREAGKMLADALLGAS